MFLLLFGWLAFLFFGLFSFSLFSFFLFSFLFSSKETVASLTQGAAEECSPKPHLHPRGSPRILAKWDLKCP